MYEAFFVSGFLYHLPSEQILLRQNNRSVPVWSLFESKGHGKAEPISIFHAALKTLLNIKIAREAIYPVYDYLDKDKELNCYVFYAVATTKDKDRYLKKDPVMKWVAFKQIAKLPLSDQTKQNIIVAQRVINAKAREAQAQTPLPQ